MHDRTLDESLLALCPALTYLAELRERGSFSAVATALRVTPSTVSRAVRRLEGDLRLELVIQSGRGIELTTAGRRLADNASLAVHQVRRGLQEAAMAESDVVIRVGLLESLGFSYVPIVAADFVAKNPRVQFTFREGSGTAVIRMLEDREIDAAVISPAPEGHRFNVHGLFEQRIGIIVAAGSALAEQATVDLSDLSDENFVLAQRGYHLREVADRLFEPMSYRPRVILETSNLAMAAGLAAAGMGVALAPPTPHLSSSAVMVPLSDPMAGRRVAIVTLAQPACSKEVAEFVQHVITHPANQTAGRVTL